MNTSGIYKLTFRDGSTYVGKSIDIQRRWDEHFSKLISGKAAASMQKAYNKYGLPSSEVLLECHPDHISLMETFFIILIQPNLNSAATVPLTQEEFNILADSLSELAHSTCDHIKAINKYYKRVNTLEESLEEISENRNKAAIARIGRDILEDSKNRYDNLEVKYNKLKTEFDNYKNRSWWNRLWN
jgi:group I intron endonuclease